MWLLYSLSLVSLALAGDTRRQVLQLEPKAPVPVVLPAVVDPKPPSLPLPVGPKAPVPQVLPIEPKAPLPQILPFDPKALVPQVEPHPPQPLLPFIERPSGPIVPFIEPPADKKGIVIDVNYVDNDSEEGPRPPKHGGKHRKHSSSSSSSSSSSESEEEVISRPCPVHGGHKDGKHGKHGKKHGHGPHRPPPPFHGPHGHGPHGRQPGCTCGLPPAPSTVPPTPEATSTVAPTQPPKPCTIVDALHVCDPFRLAVANNTGPLSSCPLVEHDFLLRQFEFCIANYCGAQKEEVCANIREVTKACWIAEDQPVNREDWVAQAGCQLAVPSTGAPTTPAPPTVAPSTHKPKKHGHGKKQPKEEKKEDAPSWWGKWKKKWGEFIKRKEN